MFWKSDGPAVRHLDRRRDRVHGPDGLGRAAAEGHGRRRCPEGQYGSYAVVGALALYLDFINLFLFLLRFLGGRRD